jgi:hypothetical protein
MLVTPVVRWCRLAHGVIVMEIRRTLHLVCFGPLLIRLRWWVRWLVGLATTASGPGAGRQGWPGSARSSSPHYGLASVACKP